MKKLSMPFISCAVASGLIVAGGLSASAQTLALQLQAINYNPGTGVWLDSSGNNNNAQFLNGTTPTFDVGVTPDMLSAVNIVGANASYGVGSHFSLLNPITAGSGYTVFAYVQPTGSSGSRQALTGGSGSGALEYNIYGGNQDFLREYLQDVGHGTATVPTSSFSLVDLAVSSTLVGSFNFNGSPDGTTSSGTAFSNPITQIGNNEGGGDFFSGDIAEIDIYHGVLTSDQIASVEATLTGEYITGTIPVIPVPEPTTLAMLAGGFGLLFAARRFGRKQA
jgi:hypothetical protein